MSMNTHPQFLEAFAQYLTTNDHASLRDYCIQPEHLQRLAVYRNGFYKASCDALAANFPTVLSLVGRDYFYTLAKAYVSNTPPQTGSLVGYGDTFAAYLHTHEQDHQLPYLSDIARLDYVWLTVLHGLNINAAKKRTTPLTPEGFGEAMAHVGQDPSQLLVALRPDLVLLELTWPVSNLWQQLKLNDQLPKRLSLEPQPQTVLFWHSESQVFFNPLSAAETTFLATLTNGEPLATAAEQALFIDPDFDLSTTFGHWLAEGFFTLPSQAC